MNMFQKLFMVDKDAPSTPPNPEKAAPVQQQDQFYQEQRGESKSPSLPEQVDFSSLLGPSKKAEGGEIPEMPSISKVLTDDALKNLAGQVNFAGFVPPEIKEANPDIASAMEAMSKAVYLTALKHSGALYDAGLDSYDKRASAHSQKKLEQFLADTPWREDNTFGRPDVSPVMKPVIDALRNEFPTAPEDWIKQQAKNYLVNVGKAAAQDLGVSFGGESESYPSRNGSDKKVDWMRFATGQPH